MGTLEPKGLEDILCAIMMPSSLPWAVLTGLCFTDESDITTCIVIRYDH